MVKSTYPKGVWFATKRDRLGGLLRYGYYGRGPGTKALGRQDTPEFYERLAEAMRREPTQGNVAHLLWEYRQSAEFRRLRTRTQADYRKHLDRIQIKFGATSLKAMAAPEIANVLYRWRDVMGEASPRQADYAVGVLGTLLAWGLKRGRVTHNRAAQIESLYKADRSQKVWSSVQIARFLATAPEPLGRALILALETGQSQTDLLTMAWSAVRDRVIVGKRQKTGVPIAVPISPILRTCLDACPGGKSVTILTRSDGLPWEPKGNGFRAAWRAACAAAEISGVTFNDLRGTFMTRRREAGWSEDEVALCSGHPMGKRGAFHAYIDRAAVAMANAERLVERWYGPQPEHGLQTGLQTPGVPNSLSN